MMTNIVQLDKSRGFTRMDNELYEALIGADLSGRELRVALAVHRLTAGFNQDESRITASVIADMSGIRREHVSRMLCELLRQR
ncbi:replication protein, partial [Pseudomonas aeruginosa]